MSDEVEDMVEVEGEVCQHLTLILLPLYAAAECSADHYVVHYNHRTYSKEEAADVDTVYSYYSCSDAAAAYACDAVVD
jgi:hypothetical protein